MREDEYRKGMPAIESAAYIGTPLATFIRHVKTGKMPKPITAPEANLEKRWSSKDIDAKMQGDVLPFSAPALRAKSNIPQPTGLLSPEAILAAATAIQRCRSGIYFLIKAGRIIYIGQSVNILSRLSSHVSEKDFDSWHWVPCPVAALYKWERAYIDALMPELNRDKITAQRRAAQEL